MRTLAAAAALLLASPALAQQQVPCAPAPDLLGQFARQYGETVAWIGGTAADGFVLLMNKDTGSWTIIRLAPDKACGVAAGQGGQLVDLPPKGEPS